MTQLTTLSDTGLPVPSTLLLLTSTSIPLHLPKRLPRLNGDTRRRKARLRKKLEKQDRIRFAPVIRNVVAGMKLAVIGKLERELFANAATERPENKT
jgi:hypothetical protein